MQDYRDQPKQSFHWGLSAMQVYGSEVCNTTPQKSVFRFEVSGSSGLGIRCAEVLGLRE